MKCYLIIVLLLMCCGCQTIEGVGGKDQATPERSTPESNASQAQLLIGEWELVDDRQVSRDGEIRPGKVNSRTYRFTRDGEMTSDFESKYGEVRRNNGAISS